MRSFITYSWFFTGISQWMWHSLCKPSVHFSADRKPFLVSPIRATYPLQVLIQSAPVATIPNRGNGISVLEFLLFDQPQGEKLNSHAQCCVKRGCQSKNLCRWHNLQYCQPFAFSSLCRTASGHGVLKKKFNKEDISFYMRSFRIRLSSRNNFVF